MSKRMDLGMVLLATEFATRKHRNQRRKDCEATPYINHPLALARLLCVEGQIRDSVVIAAAILHDTIDHTRTTRGALLIQKPLTMTQPARKRWCYLKLRPARDVALS